MAKSDSSAVQKLIELAQQKPLELDVDLDGLFAESPRREHHALPPPRRGAATSMSPSSSMPPLPRTRAPVSTHTGFQAPPPPKTRDSLPAVSPVAVDTGPLSLRDLGELTFREDEVPHTQQTPRRAGIAPWVIAGAFALGVGFAGVYIVAEGLDQPAPSPDRAVAAAATATTTTAAPAPVAPPAPAAPTPAPAAAAAEPALAAAPAGPVTVSFLSQPPGATVVLVDGGTMTPLGKTPLTAPLTVGKSHEVLFTLEGRATVLAKVDPATRTEVSVELAAGAEPAAAPSAPAVAAPAPAAPAVTPPAAAEPRPSENRTKRARAESKPAKAEPKRVAAAGRGTLMLGAKPPCDIMIDGKPTGLTTPQREIPLPAGSHSITLVNRQHGIRKTFSVSVPSGDTVKVVKDFTDLMK